VTDVDRFRCSLAADPNQKDASTHFEVVIAFRERENAEKAVAQIEWAMNYAHLEPFEMEIQEVAGDV
jgi:hypothetical protein